MSDYQDHAVETVPVADYWLGSWRISVDRRALTAKELSTAYDRIASRWGALIQRLGYRSAYRGLFEQLIKDTEALTSARSLQVLDCGVGTGDLSLALKSTMAGPVDFEGIDISSSMVSEAEHAFSKAGIGANL